MNEGPGSRLRWSEAATIREVLDAFGDWGRQTLLDHGFDVGRGFTDHLSQFQSLRSASHSGQLRDLGGFLRKLNYRPSWDATESLIRLGFARMAAATDEARDLGSWVLAGLAADIALVTAFLIIRATSTSEVLSALPQFKADWIIPLLPFAASASIFLVAGVMNRFRDLPDPFGIEQWLLRHDEAVRSAYLLVALENATKVQRELQQIPRILLVAAYFLALLGTFECAALGFGVL